eukprot:1173777-Alexandrium_andersonii.AAC.1
MEVDADNGAAVQPDAPVAEPELEPGARHDALSDAVLRQLRAAEAVVRDTRARSPAAGRRQ